MHKIKYRLYADDRLISEEEFGEEDNATPYYDDCYECNVPEEFIEYVTKHDIEEECIRSFMNYRRSDYDTNTSELMSILQHFKYLER